MNIYYQWFSWAYWHSSSIIAAKNLWFLEENIFWIDSFKKVFEKIDEGNIWVLPFENSYAGSIHENFYHAISWNYKIIWEIFLEINHNLLAKTDDISKIKKVYSHPQALMQTFEFCKKYNFEQIPFSDTAWAAKYVLEKNDETIASISSSLAWEIYNLNNLKSNIQDQNWNTTKFFVIVKNENNILQKLNYSWKKSNKVSIIFKTKDSPSALYKCLWAFATRFINLVKIESLPAKQNRFEYIFWIDFEKNVDEKAIFDALEELSFFSKDLKILWDY